MPLYLSVFAIDPPSHENEYHAALPLVLDEVLFGQQRVWEHRFTFAHKGNHTRAQNIEEFSLGIWVKLIELQCDAGCVRVSS